MVNDAHVYCSSSSFFTLILLSVCCILCIYLFSTTTFEISPAINILKHSSGLRTSFGDKKNVLEKAQKSRVFFILNESYIIIYSYFPFSVPFHYAASVLITFEMQ